MSREVKDLTGQRFGKLLVIRMNGKDIDGRVCYLCRCDCGNEVVLRSGNIQRTKSCGCLVGNRKKDRREGAFPVPSVNAEPRRDCNAYNPEFDCCRALTEMLCVTRGACKFYKQREE